MRTRITYLAERAKTLGMRVDEEPDGTFVIHVHEREEAPETLLEESQQAWERRRLRAHMDRLACLMDIQVRAADMRYSDAAVGLCVRGYLPTIAEAIEILNDARPIHSDQHHRAALRQLDQLMGERPENPRIELLAILIEDYEKQHFPIGSAATQKHSPESG